VLGQPFVPMYDYYIKVIRNLVWGLNGVSEGRPRIETYERPNDGHYVKITLEYSARDRQLRIMSKYTDGTDVYTIADVDVPE